MNIQWTLWFGTESKLSPVSQTVVHIDSKVKAVESKVSPEFPTVELESQPVESSPEPQIIDLWSCPKSQAMETELSLWSQVVESESSAKASIQN